MLKKTAQQSLLDFIMKIMPELQDGKGGPIFLMLDRRPTVNKKAVKALMSMWKDEDAEVSARKFKRPPELTAAEIDLMVKENLIKDHGNEIEITAKGVEVIKTNILGDERSSFEDDGVPLDHDIATANTKPKRKMVKGAKRASKNISGGGNWYEKSLLKASANEENIKQVIGMLINYAEHNIGQVTHIIAFAESAVKKGPPTDQKLIPMYNIVKQVADGFGMFATKRLELEDLKALGVQAKQFESMF
jgi:hypothetical protein